MKKIFYIAAAALLVSILTGLLLAKSISSWILRGSVASPRLVVHSTAADGNLAVVLRSQLEKDYRRLQSHYGVDLQEPIHVHLFTGTLLYNMAFGNPFPLPRRTYAGQTIGNHSYVLIPGNWQPAPDSVFPPDRGRTTAAHEMTHAFVHQINPTVEGWVTEGIAQYEESAVFDDTIRRVGFSSVIGQPIREGRIPRLDSLFTVNKGTASIGADYRFAGSFFDFAATTYGYPAIVRFVRSHDFKSSFGKEQAVIQEEWTAYLEAHYVF
jgi:hypothetical protein